MRTFFELNNGKYQILFLLSIFYKEGLKSSWSETFAGHAFAASPPLISWQAHIIDSSDI